MRPDDPLRRTALYYCCQKVTRAAFATLFDATYYGVENVPASGGAIIAANHQSFLDPPLIGTPLDRPVSYMAKSELFENPYFGWFIRNLHAFPVRQGKGDRAAIIETVDRLKSGHLLNMYPEGSRSEDGKIARFESGVSLIIRRAEVPVVPAAIEGSFGAWPKGQGLFRPRPVKVMYGRPMVLHHLPPTEVTRVLEARIREMFEELRAFPVGAAGGPGSA